MGFDFDSDFGDFILILFLAKAFVNTGGRLVLHGLHRSGEHARITNFL